MDWIQYRLFFEYGSDIDTILFLLMENGFEGSYEDSILDVFQTEDGYGYRVKEEEDVQIITFSKQEIAGETWSEWFLSLGLKKVEREWAEKQSGEEWKEVFTPLMITPNIQLIPEWMRGNIDNDVEYCLYLEPGAAFGTGFHGTTQDCMRILNEMNIEGSRVLDIGSGSGILSILAKKMGASVVYAMDNNPSAELELQKNMGFNDMSVGIEFIYGDALALPFPKVDVVISNIGLTENIQLLPKITDSLTLEGRILASGIVEWGESKFTQDYEANGWQPIHRLQTNEWVTLLFEKKKFS